MTHRKSEPLRRGRVHPRTRRWKSPWFGVSVALLGVLVGAGTLTNLDGRFMLRHLPPDTYDLVVELLGYTSKTITGIEIQPGKTVRLNVTLPPEAIQVEGVTVSVERERGNAAAVLNERRNAAAVLDAVGSQDISRSPGSGGAGLVMPTDGRVLETTTYPGAVEPGTSLTNAWYSGWTVWTEGGSDSRPGIAE